MYKAHFEITSIVLAIILVGQIQIFLIAPCTKIYARIRFYIIRT
jgi:hypothetical protein